MKVIISGMAWLDRSELTPRQVSNIVNRLTIQPKQTSDVADAVPDPINLWRLDEARNLLGVPRGFYKSMSSQSNEEILRVGYGAPMRILENKARFDGPFKEQPAAIEELLQALRPSGKDDSWGGAFLQAFPAFGKTTVSLEVARRLGRRTLILVHQEFFLNQWKKRIAEFLPGAVIGVIQQDRCEYEQTAKGEKPDFVIALMQSLVRDESGDRYPQELYGPDVFGFIVVDESHHLGAATFARIVPRFSAAYRLSLTATPRRKDGAEDVFFYHVSPVTYIARTESVRPSLRRIYTDTMLRPIARGQYRVSADKLNSAQIVNQICADRDRTRAVVDDVVQAVRNSRKVMVVSARLDHLREMMDQTWQILRGMNLPFVPILDAYTGEWFTGEKWDNTTKTHRKGDPKTAPRTESDRHKAERANVLFATQQLCAEGLDVPALDVLILSTPVSDVEQVVGRVRRHCIPSAKCEHYCPWRAGKCQGKPIPIVVDVIDENIPRLKGMARRRERFYQTCCTV